MSLVRSLPVRGLPVRSLPVRGLPVRRSARKGLGFWVLGFGFWILDFGFWVLGFGFWILRFGFSEASYTRKENLLGFGFWILGFGFWIFGFWILGFGFWILDFGFPPHKKPSRKGPCKGERSLKGQKVQKQHNPKKKRPFWVYGTQAEIPAQFW